MEKRLTQEQLQRVLGVFFQHGYCVKDDEYIGAVDNNDGRRDHNVIGIMPNDDVLGVELNIFIYSIAFDRDWKDVFTEYCERVVKAVPELEPVDTVEYIDSLNDVWSFVFKQ